MNKRWTKKRFKTNTALNPVGCWIWLGKCDRDGYGNNCKHRKAWQLFIGEIPRGMCVLHICDTPSCVNPAHLWLGTYLDNKIDCIRKRRDARGEKNWAFGRIGEKHPFFGKRHSKETLEKIRKAMKEVHRKRTPEERKLRARHAAKTRKTPRNV
jgi:hypothetical protein